MPNIPGTLSLNFELHCLFSIASGKANTSNNDELG